MPYSRFPLAIHVLITLQNIQFTHVAQYENNKQPNPIKKWSEDLNGHFSKEEHTDGQEAHAKISLGNLAQ